MVNMVAYPRSSALPRISQGTIESITNVLDEVGVTLQANGDTWSLTFHGDPSETIELSADQQAIFDHAGAFDANRKPRLSIVEQQLRRVNYALTQQTIAQA
jgi:hypothetical protein